MWNLRPPSSSAALGHFDAIVQAKHRERRARLSTLRSFIERRYGTYHNDATSLRTSMHPSPDLTDQQRSDLLHCYDSGCAALDGLKASITDNQEAGRASLCPYCGRGPAESWDHVLPKAASWFPELAVLSSNLTKVCSRCNTRRGTRWRETFHVYWDQLDEQPQCLRARLIEAATVDWDVEFSIDPDSGASEAFVRQLESHVDTLGLLEVWREAAREKLHRIADEMAQYAELGLTIDVAQKVFVGQARALRECYGHNHWEAVLLDQVACSRRFFECGKLSP